MPKRLTPEDRAIFRAAMKEIKPLKMKRKMSLAKKNMTNLEKSQQKKNSPPIDWRRPLPTLQALSNANADFLSSWALSDFIADPVYADTVISYRHENFSPKDFRNLQKGLFRIEAELDLHHHTRDLARAHLVDFLVRAYENQLRVVRIIHGKGSPTSADAATLKNLVNTWLRQIPLVLAYSSALPRDGGTGAIYVFLRKGQSS